MVAFAIILSFFMGVIKMSIRRNSNLKIFIRYIVPSMLSMALMAIYTFTDTFVVGRELGTIALGAMGICTPILTVTYSLGFLCGMGGGALYAIDTGKKDAVHANKVFTTSLLMLIVTGGLIAIMGNIFTVPLANFLGADEENISYVLPYLRCIVSYAPGFMLDVFLMTYMKNDGHPNVAMVSTVTGTGLNIVLDCLFVFVFKWGMFGAAFATCIGSAACSIVNIVYILTKKLNLRPHIKNISAGLIPRVFRAGFSVFILECSSAIVTFVFIKQATGFYGTVGASIYTIIMNWTLVCFNLVMGIAQSVQPLISISYGERNFRKAHTFRKYALISSLIAGTVFLLIGYTFTEPLITVFAEDALSIVGQAANCFRLYLPAYFMMGIGISIGIYFQAVESASKSLIIMLLRGIIMPVAGAFVLPFIFDERALWLSMPFAELFTALTAVVLALISDKKARQAAVSDTVSIHETGTNMLVITISREFGSGGHEIGQELAERLGIPVYDKEVPELTAVQTGLSSKTVHETEDRNIYPFGLYTKGHYSQMPNRIFLAQCKVIEELAAKGSCVIIGRCADYILHDKYPTLSVFVHAPLEMRVKRIVEYDGCTERQAVRKISESDKARAGYHDFYTNFEWGKSQNYDITINSALGIDASVKTLLDLIGSCFGDFAEKS